MKTARKDQDKLLEELEDFTSRIVSGRSTNATPKDIREKSSEFLRILEENHTGLTDQVKKALPTS